MDTRIKICGITCVDDAQAAIGAGADMLGLNFAPVSPRCIDVEEAARIARAVGDAAMRVGVFLDQSAAEVSEVIAQVPLDLLQFHGSEPEAFALQFDIPYMKVFRVAGKFAAERACAEYPRAWALLLDSYVAGVPGGTGQRFNPEFWPADCALPLMLAGGLDADNVTAAVMALRPFGVDVSGGVETAVKGRKDHQKMIEFVSAVKRAGEQVEEQVEESVQEPAEER